MKTILIPTERQENMSSALQTATSIAAKADRDQRADRVER
jgi:hypothetical protein